MNNKTYAYVVEYTESLDNPKWEPLSLEVSFPGQAVRSVLARMENYPYSAAQMRVRRVKSGVELIELMMNHEANCQPGAERVGLDLPEA